jgi:hypothetical protein
MTQQVPPLDYVSKQPIVVVVFDQRGASSRTESLEIS